MSETIRQAGPFRFVNRTRYNGEDIEAIFNLWRQAVKSQTGNPDCEPSRHRYVHAVDVFDISDYKPAAVFQKKREWQAGSNRSVEVIRPEYLNGPGYSASTAWKIGIVEPQRLFQSEVEALAHGTQHAPAELSVQMVQVFSHMFSEVDGVPSAAYQAMKETVRQQAALIKIRIEDKRENVATNPGRKLRVVRSRAANAASSLICSGGDAARHLQVFRNQLKNHLRDFAATQIDTNFTLEEADDLTRSLDDLVKRIEAFKAELVG